MKVIKKDGRLQEMNDDKIKRSILSSTSEDKPLLNESDVNLIVKDIVSYIKKIRGEDGNTSSYEIIGTVIEILKRDGFEDVIKEYIGFVKK